MKTLVIIPTYNEAANVESITAAVRAVVDVDVLVVDDESPDGTARIAEEAAGRSGGRIRVLRRTGKPASFARSYLDGYRAALDGGYERVVTMDADFSHDPAYLPAMLHASETADLVVGSRYVAGGGVKNWSFLRRTTSRWGGLYARFVLGLPVNDPTAGFQVLSRRMLELVLAQAPRSNGYGFQVEQKHLANRAGLRIVEVPIVFVDRRAGQSKMSVGIALEAVWRVWAFRFRARPALPAPPVPKARTDA